MKSGGDAIESAGAREFFRREQEELLWKTAAETADKVTDMYAHNPNGFDAVECQNELGFGMLKCVEIEIAMSTGPGGEITEQEATLFQDTGALSAEEIRLIRGDDGRKALRERAKWLADHSETKWWRWDYDEKTRNKMAEERLAIDDYLSQIWRANLPNCSEVQKRMGIAASGDSNRFVPECRGNKFVSP